MTSRAGAALYTALATGLAVLCLGLVMTEAGGSRPPAGSDEPFVPIQEDGGDGEALVPERPPLERRRSDRTGAAADTLEGDSSLDPPSRRGATVALLRRTTALRKRPGGRRLVRQSRLTEWGSPTVLTVVEQRGGWLGVLTPELDNGQLGWLRADRAELLGVRWAIQADTSDRTLTVYRGGRRVRRLSVGVGSPRTPTPPGLYGVTDKLRVTAAGSTYGCCVLALTGHQPQLARGWPGGDRLAIHSTRNPASVGQATSFGCLRTFPAEARWLIEKVPLGTPVFFEP